MAKAYRFNESLFGPAWMPPYNVPSNEPECFRDLQVFALDPSISRYNGSVATICVPREAIINTGPETQLFRVDQSDEAAGLEYRELDLDRDLQLLASGLTPDPADAQFHAQMVYAIALLTYETFRKALGRHVGWAFYNKEGYRPQPLTLYPFGMLEKNAYYDRRERAIRFGYFNVALKNSYPPHKEYMFTSLSSDIITHEVSHALLDGLRPYFDKPTNPQVPAFHEAFADIIALLQRFTYKELITTQLGRAHGNLSRSALLGMIAPELGRAAGRPRGLRTFQPALDQAENDPLGKNDIDVVRLDQLHEHDRQVPHKLGRILAEAIFDAFQVILNRKLQPIICLASNGTGKLPDGNLPAALLERIVHDTQRTASQFLAICIRAIDYCPPVHIEFGDYLRALITADAQLIKIDPYGYREAIINACTMRGIFPRHVTTLSESALIWHPPESPICIEELGLSQMNFLGDPAIPKDAAEVRRQGECMGRALVNMPALRSELGLHAIDQHYAKPEIVSIRSSRRVGPDDQVGFDLIIEVIQARNVTIAGRRLPLYGGATLVLDPLGNVRFVVRKRVDNDERLQEVGDFLAMPENQHFLSMLVDDRPFDFKALCLVEDST